MPVIPGGGGGGGGGTGLSTLTIQSVINWARIHTKLIPIVGVAGFSNEPAISIANDVLSELLSAPFNWKFNRVEAPMFVTRPFVQDYQYSGATAFVLSPNGTNYGGGVGIGLATNNAITEATNLVTVNTLDPHPFAVGQTVFLNGCTVPNYNSTFTQTNIASTWSGGYTISAVPSTTSFQFTHPTSGLGVSGGAGIFDWGWGEQVNFQDINSTATPQPIQIGQMVRNLNTQSYVDNPSKLSMKKDSGTGVVTFRLYAVPGTYLWQVMPVYQARPPLLTNPAGTWAPIPDQLGFVLRQGFLTMAYRYTDDAKYKIENAKWQIMIQKALGIQDAETQDEAFYPARGIMIG